MMTMNIANEAERWVSVGEAAEHLGCCPDFLRARIRQGMPHLPVGSDYLAPVPMFSFVAFHDQGSGQWAVIVIPPSTEQPHIFIKEFSGNPGKHEWFVPINDTTERAGAADYARVLTSRPLRWSGRAGPASVNAPQVLRALHVPPKAQRERHSRAIGRDT
jgi:hypothetical protein